MPDIGAVHINQTDWKADITLDKNGGIILPGIHLCGETLEFNGKTYSCGDDGKFYEEGIPFNDEVEKTKIDVNIAKSVEEKQYVFGWASIATLKNGEKPFDWQGDIIPEDEIEKMAYEYVEFYGQTGEEHQGPALGRCIESMAFTEEKCLALGIPTDCVHKGWWIGFHVPDKEVWNKIKSGQYKQFSIQGRAKRIPFTV